MNVRLIQIDGALPNLALMRLSAFHKRQGDDVYFTRGFRGIQPLLWEPQQYDRVYASAIFRFSEPKVAQLQQQWPHAVVGGTGTLSVSRVEDYVDEVQDLDYSIYPDFDASIGFTQRGCRLKCKFCYVPAKEGKNRPASTIADLWRGAPWPKKLHLLDNDFFGNPEWRARIAEIREGGFRVCLSQGINVRLIDDEAAAALASIEYRDTKFKERKLYTAWDNLGDEAIFFRGVDTLERAGILPTRLMAYMLIGFDPQETWERIWYRFMRMVARGIEPYPMVFDRSRADLLCFQRWVLTGLYRIVKWPDYVRATKTQASVEGYFAAGNEVEEKLVMNVATLFAQGEA